MSETKTWLAISRNRAGISPDVTVTEGRHAVFKVLLEELRQHRELVPLFNEQLPGQAMEESNPKIEWRVRERQK